MAVCIVGWAHSKFGRLDGLDLEQLIGGVTQGALADAGLGGAEVDGIWLGQLNGGFVPEIFASSLPMQANAALRWAPATRLENACASGAAALLVGAEKMTAVSGAEVTRILGNASYVPEEASQGLSFPGIFGRIAQAYFERHGDHGAVLARIAAKNHANGVRNPWAQMRKDLGFEFCNEVSERNPLIAAPLRKTDCSLVSDGAAALVLVDASLARQFRRAVALRSRVQVNDFLPLSRRDPLAFEGPRRAWAQALQQAGIGVRDLSFAEVHDCFTIAELLSYEAMGLAPPGQGARVLEQGLVMADGALPVNASGGLKAKGHPIGATGVSMHVLAAMQLVGEAGEMQLPQPRLGGVFNMGGSAVANYVSVLERVQ